MRDPCNICNSGFVFAGFAYLFVRCDIYPAFQPDETDAVIKGISALIELWGDALLSECAEDHFRKPDGNLLFIPGALVNEAVLRYGVDPVLIDDAFVVTLDLITADICLLTKAGLEHPGRSVIYRFDHCFVQCSKAEPPLPVFCISIAKRRQYLSRRSFIDERSPSRLSFFQRYDIYQHFSLFYSECIAVVVGNMVLAAL